MDAQNSSPAARAKRRGYAVKALLAAILALMLAAVLLANCRIYTVQGLSMQPTLGKGDQLHYLKYHTPEYGDLVVFTTEYDLVVKRVIGLPGDAISVDPDGSVIRNGAPLAEPYMRRDALGNSAMALAVVEDGHIFVLGDNRGASMDSRDARIGQIRFADVAGYVDRILRPIGAAEEEPADEG